MANLDQSFDIVETINSADQEGIRKAVGTWKGSITSRSTLKPKKF